MQAPGTRQVLLHKSLRTHNLTTQEEHAEHTTPLPMLRHKAMQEQIKGQDFETHSQDTKPSPPPPSIRSDPIHPSILPPYTSPFPNTPSRPTAFPPRTSQETEQSRSQSRSDQATTMHWTLCSTPCFLTRLLAYPPPLASILACLITRILA